MVRVVPAFHDPALGLRISRERALFYDQGADAAEDRPAHVRAASGLAWLGDRLAVVQDDANFVAILDMTTNGVECITLPRGAGGARLFGEARGNKADKLDLESCVVTEIRGRRSLVAFGSGSTSARERIAVVPESTDSGYVVECPRLYAALRACVDFSGSELNIEGAVLDGETLRLFQRGNGAARGMVRPVNASVEVALGPLRAALEGGGEGSPSLGDVTRYELGALDGVALTFTDVALAPGGRMLYLATAEASPDTFHDGAVTGTVAGVIDGQTARHGFLTNQDGERALRKAEGIVLSRQDPTRAYVAFDPDDVNMPAALAEATWIGL